MNTQFDIYLMGSSEYPIYDEHPWIGTYSSWGQIHWQSYDELADAIEALLVLANEPEKPFDNFDPNHFWVVDSNDRCALSGALLEAGVSYIEPVFDDKAIQTILQTCEALRQEAAVEAGWDNFETAKKLRHEADLLKLKLIDKAYQYHSVIEYYRGL